MHKELEKWDKALTAYPATSPIAGNLTVWKKSCKISDAVWGVSRWADDWCGIPIDLMEVTDQLVEEGYTPSLYCSPGYWSGEDTGWHQLHLENGDQTVSLHFKAIESLSEEYYNAEGIKKSIETFQKPDKVKLLELNQRTENSRHSQMTAIEKALRENLGDDEDFRAALGELYAVHFPQNK
jgi:hypothetical protein